jgi:hypothetical protein
VRKAHTVLRVNSGIVGPAMSQHSDHPLQGFRSDALSIEIEYAGYATHDGSTLGMVSSSDCWRNCIPFDELVVFFLRRWNA